MSNSTDPYVPMPDTCHPYYASRAGVIRSGIARGDAQGLRVAEPPRLSASFATEGERVTSDAGMRIRTLTVKRCAAPAPFVGNPLLVRGFYTWRVGVDDLGRHIAGPAELQMSPA